MTEILKLKMQLRCLKKVIAVKRITLAIIGIKKKIKLTDLLNLKDSELIKNVKSKKFLVIKSDENLIDVIEKCKDFIGESIPVIDNENKKSF